MKHKTTIALAATALLLLGGCSSASDEEADAGETVTVVVKDMAYEPATVTIQPGDTVEWVWEGSLPHDVVMDDSAPEVFKSELQSEGSYTHTFEETGAYSYHCTPHPQMTGEVIVE